MLKSGRLAVLEVLLIVIVSSAVMFAGLERGSLADWDEAVHAEVAKEVLETGDPFVMHMGGNPWVQKPPLVMLLTALSYKFLGVTTFASRLWPALFGVGAALATYLAARYLFDHWVALMASLALVSFPHFVHMSRMLMLDVPVTFFVVLSLYFFALTVREGRGFLAFGVTVGLGVLSKHVVGLLPILIVVPCMVFPSFRKGLNAKAYLWSFVAFMAVLAPWYGTQLLLYPNLFGQNYIHSYFIDRITSAMHGHDYGNTYYLKVLWSGFGGWSYPIVVSLALLAISAWRSRRFGEVLLLSWIVVTAGVFFLARTKLPWYLMPLYPAFAITLAYLFGRLNVGSRRAGVLVFALLFALSFRLPEPFYCNSAMYNMNAIGKDGIVVDASVGSSPGERFYLGFGRYPSGELLRKDGVYVSTTKAYQKNYGGMRKVYEAGGYVMFSKDGLPVDYASLSVPPVSQKPVRYCYAYMPQNLG